MSTLEKAISIAANKHAGHTDKGGKPLILHCMRVMTSVNTLDEQIVAVLHDVFETTDTSASYLLGEGFTDAQIAAIESVTRRQGETYIQAAHRAAVNPIGRVVKLAEVNDNSDISRIQNPTPLDMERVENLLMVREILLAFKVPESELAEKFVEDFCKLNSTQFMSLNGHVQLALKSGCTYIEIKEAIEHGISIYEYANVLGYLSHKLALNASEIGMNMRHLWTGMKLLIEHELATDDAYSKLNIAHSKNYDLRSYALGIVSGCNEDEIQECVEKKLSLQFYVNLRKFASKSHSEIMDACQKGIGTRELYAAFLDKQSLRKIPIYLDCEPNSGGWGELIEKARIKYA